MNCLCFFLIRKVVAFRLFLSGCGSLADDRFGSRSNSPDKAQQLTSNRGNDLSLGLAGRAQLHIPLVQAVLRFPRDFLGLFRNALLPPAQAIPDARWPTIAPCCFADDPSQVRVPSFSDASAPDALATGVFAWHRAAITHQLSSTAKTRYPGPARPQWSQPRYLRYPEVPADR